MTAPKVLGSENRYLRPSNTRRDGQDPAGACVSGMLNNGDDLMDAVENYVRDCFVRESPPRVSELAQILNVSRTRLNQLFGTCHAGTLTAFLKERQIEYAKELLTKSALPLTVVAYRAAFGTRASFYRAFVKATGVTPRVYRLTSSK